ncbi:MAG: Gfo/Idh/MocA family oxidoreductase [Sandarakinorhabdus sp.]|nr:Gfo/Idh/MocA family oxidoreductase [Sandarakinorhabdus sp.]
MTAAPVLRVGIIGAARVATYAMIAPARATPRVEVVAVAARDPLRGRAYAETHGIGRVHDSYAALVADPDVDLVYVATPPRFHAEHARLAIAAGKPVLVEKPFTMDTAEAAALLADARAAGVPIFEAMHSRHRPVWAMIAGLLPSIGKLQSVDAVFDVAVSTADDEFRWQDALGGGALMDLGIYPLAWARAVAGEPVAVISASMRRRRQSDAAFEARLMMPGGVVAAVAADMEAPRRAALTIAGSLGAMRLDGALMQQPGQSLVVTTAGGTRSYPIDGPSTFDAQLAAVAATLLEGAPFPLAADDPAASMRAIDMVRAAA